MNIICCSETWLDNGVSDRLIEISGKNVFRCDRHVNVNDCSRRNFGGGVCLYVGEPFKSFAEKILNYSKIPNNTLQDFNVCG